LVISGLPTERFCFEGFLPRIKKGRRAILQKWEQEQRTIVFYESPYRLVKTLKELSPLFGERNIAVARELTKTYEQVIRGRLTEVLEFFTGNSPKGEIVVVIQGSNEIKKTPQKGPTDICECVDNLVRHGHNKKDAIKEAAILLGVSKREVYNTILKAEKKGTE